MATITEVSACAYEVPTATPESDGTLAWDKTTLVYAQIEAEGQTGLGYTYADVSTAKVITTLLKPTILGKDAMDIGARGADMYTAIRNLGRGGITTMAISALDVALWDLKGKILGVPTCKLLGSTRAEVPIYGSGGFTSYTKHELAEHLSAWTQAGIPRVKMKVGRDPNADVRRVEAARAAIGPDAELFVDANGAYTPQQALRFAHAFAHSNVTWFEEPVYHQEYAATRFVREHAPPGMEISLGEYGYAPYDFQRMRDADCVDVLQADATRCGGFSGLLAVDALCRGVSLPLSTHCAPSLHLHAAQACGQLRHMEYFFDHVRIEHMLFDGPQAPKNGTLTPDLTRPGIGLTFKGIDAERYAINA